MSSLSCRDSGRPHASIGPARLAVGADFLTRLIPDASTATGLAWVAEIVRKTADETVNNSTTLQNDDALLWTIGANDVWFFHAYLGVISTAVADIKYGWSVPASATMLWGATSTTSATTAAFTAGSTAAGLTAGSAPAYSTGGSNQLQGLAGWVKGGGTAGTVNLQWAQNALEVSDTKVLADSILMLWRLA